MVPRNLARRRVVDIFDEVSEDLRAERARRFVRRYGVLLIVAAIAVVAGVGAWQVWRWRAAQNVGQVATAFMDAMRTATPPLSGALTKPARDRALQQFLDLAGSAPEGYRTLARLRAAQLRSAAGDAAGALSLWDQVSSDTQADPLLRDLANLLWVQHQVDAGDPAAVEGRLAPLVAQGNTWRPLAQEAQALLWIRTGQDAKARELLTRLQADTAVPDGIRARAGGLLSRLIGPAPVAPAGPPAGTPGARVTQ